MWNARIVALVGLLGYGTGVISGVLLLTGGGVAAFC